jgi:hypothetical protein
VGQSGLREDGATDPSSFSGIGSTHSARSLASYYAAAVGKTGVRFTQKNRISPST